MRCAHSQHSDPLSTHFSTPNFCFGRGILWCSASGTRAVERCSNIWAQTQPSWLSLERGVPSALMACLCRARAFGQAALSASCASLRLLSGGFENRQTGLRGRQPHERGLRFPRHQRQTLAQDFCYPCCWLAEIKVVWSTGLVGSREGGFLQGNWGLV